MRLLVVHKDYAPQARKLMEERVPRDVRLVIFGGEREPRGDALETFRLHRGAICGCLNVNRKYVRAMENEFSLSIEINVASLAALDAISNWLVPLSEEVVEQTLPSDAFTEASRKQSRLLLADGAIRDANTIAPARYAFAARSAAALGEYAGIVDKAGRLIDFFVARELSFAVNGRIRASYTIFLPDRKIVASTEWHLKEGDKTTRDYAARVYFHTVQLGPDWYVVVLRCGPHPEENFSTTLVLPYDST